MAFGKRSAAMMPAKGIGTSCLGRAGRRPAGPHIASTVIAGLVLGFGGVAAGTTLVQASEQAGLLQFFESIFKPPGPTAPVADRPSRKRFASLPDARRAGATSLRRFSPRPGSSSLGAGNSLRSAKLSTPMPLPVATNGPQTVCVRTCDGYLFPLGRLGSQHDVPVHQTACAAACPNAATTLFTLPAGRTELDQSISLKGQPYLSMAWANVYRQKRVPNCSCQPPGAAAAHIPLDRDATLRAGDVVATQDSADIVTKIVRGKLKTADYRSARGVSRHARREIDRHIGAMQRDAAEAAFRRSLRVAEAKAVRARVAEASVTRMRLLDADRRFDELPDAATGRQSFAPIRVVSQSLTEQ